MKAKKAFRNNAAIISVALLGENSYSSHSGGDTRYRLNQRTDGNCYGWQVSRFGNTTYAISLFVCFFLIKTMGDGWRYKGFFVVYQN